MQSFNIPPELLRGLTEKAQSEGKNIESIITAALQEQLTTYGIISMYDSGEIYKEEYYSKEELKQRRAFYNRLYIQHKPLKGNRILTGFKVLRYGRKVEVMEKVGGYISPYKGIKLIKIGDLK